MEVLMKKLLIGLLAIGSISAHAKIVAVLENGKLFSDIVSSSGTKQRKLLEKLYQTNFLNENKKYALIGYDLHAGLVCGSAYISDNIYMIKAGGIKTGVYVIQLPSNQKRLGVYATCASMPFVSNDSDPEYLEDAMAKSVNAIIVSVDEIKKPSSVNTINTTRREIHFDDL